MSHPNPHPPSLKIARVALQWSETSHESSCFLTTPDPPDARIVFESQTGPAQTHADREDDPIGVFLQLSVPLKLKGIFAHAPAHVHIHPSQIQSPVYNDDIDAPDAVRAKLPGKLARFSMMLSEPVRLIIPSNTPSPLRAREPCLGPGPRRPSILDPSHPAVYLLGGRRSIAGPSAASVCTDFCWSCRAAAAVYRDISTLRRMGGLPMGGQISITSTITAPFGRGPPMPPISTKSEGQGTKRQRQRRSTSSTCSEDAALADAGLQVKKPDLRASPPRPASESSAVQQRLALLEVLVQAQARQIDELLADNRQQKERIRECEADIGAVRLAAERAHGRVEELELEMAVQRDDLERLDGDVQYCLEQEDEIVEVVASTVSDRITDAVADAVTDRIATRGLIARNISFSLGDE
ncbi:hypothetical protein PG994_006974 [Apiospora phragmitis]|uniref:Uncharacterized protein n=1 Tax=Apiospora phragmitis TaxID=2905665 RepID=A0ABR1UZF3_9PEZI